MLVVSTDFPELTAIIVVVKLHCVFSRHANKVEDCPFFNKGPVAVFILRIDVSDIVCAELVANIGSEYQGLRIDRGYTTHIVVCCAIG